MNIKHQETKGTETKTAYSPQTPPVEEQQNTPAPPPTHIRKLLRGWLRFHSISRVVHTHLNAQPVNPQVPMRLLKQTMPRHRKVRTLVAWLLGELSLTEDERREVIQILGKIAETNSKFDNALTPIRYMIRSAIFVSVYLAFLEITRELLTHIPLYWDNRYWEMWKNFTYKNTNLPPKLQYYFAHYDNPLTSALKYLFPSSLLGMDYLAVHYLVVNFLAQVILLFVLPAPIIMPLSLWIDRRRQRLVRLEAIEALRKRGEVTALPYLLGALKSRDAKIANAAYPVVVELLPKLTPEHYGHLRSDVGQNLCLLFGARYDLPYITILDAIEKVGGSRAIPKIQWVLANEPQQEIKRRCEEVLIVLKEREQMERQTKDLLRASQEPISKETLLRPTSPQAEVETDTLLRPIDTSH